MILIYITKCFHILPHFRTIDAKCNSHNTFWAYMCANMKNKMKKFSTSIRQHGKQAGLVQDSKPVGG
jgi:hypothetical protein